MNKCEYYKVKAINLKSSTIRPSQQRKGGVSSKIPFCSNPYAEGLSLSDLEGVFGSALVLKCEGDISKCQLPGGIEQAG